MKRAPSSFDLTTDAVFAALGTASAPGAIRAAVEAGPEFASALLTRWRMPWPDPEGRDFRDGYADGMGLAHALATSSPDVFLRAVADDRELLGMVFPALGSLDGPLAVELLTRLLDDPHWSVRQRALEALLASPRPPGVALRALRRAIADEDPAVQWAALEGLATHGEPSDSSAIAALAHRGAGWRTRVEQAIAAIATGHAPLPSS